MQCQPECVGGLFELTISDPITPLPTVSKQSLQASGFWKLHLLAGQSLAPLARTLQASAAGDGVNERDQCCHLVGEGQRGMDAPRRDAWVVGNSPPRCRATVSNLTCLNPQMATPTSEIPLAGEMRSCV